MNAETLQRYAPGGDIHRTLVDRYGPSEADRAYQLALANDQSGLNALLSDLRRGVANPGGADLPEGTGGILFDQLTTDPLGAPLDSLNSQLGNALKGLVRNPLSLLFVAGGAWLAWKFVLPAVLKSLKP